MDPSINKLRQLHLAIYSYAQDANEADDGRPKPYPASLQDLATYGYLKQADLEKLTTGDLYYYRPVGEPSEKTVILELRRETNTIYAEWDGSVYSKPRKK